MDTVPIPYVERLLAVAIAAYWLWFRAERVRRREMALMELEERLRRREITEREYTRLRWDLERRQDERDGKLKCR